VLKDHPLGTVLAIDQVVAIPHFRKSIQDIGCIVPAEPIEVKVKVSAQKRWA
jgi:hypothetical protein